jgi:GMP synthase (glutamine-hydrolysing)
MRKCIAILDFGGQYAHLIANRIRRLKAYSEIFPNDVTKKELAEHGVQGIILSGGPHGVYEENAPKINPEIFELNVPVLGICYGHQLIADALGGKVKRGKIQEFGKSVVTLTQKNGIFYNFAEKSVAWMSHGDEVTDLPGGFELLGTTDDCPVAIMGDFNRNIFGVQFHPEVTHTEQGMVLLKNFIELTGLAGTWQISNYVEQITTEIQKQAEGKKVFLLVSGGVDSSVTFALLEKAIGKERVFGLFVDHGLLRKNEAKEVREMLSSSGFTNLHVEDASNLFLEKLAGVTEPEEKRAIIGNTFLEIQAKVTADLKLNPNEWLLGQGTIYPDTIESGGTRHSARIKTHHNRVPEIQKLIEEGKIIEPLKDLYKDEVREVGRQLGLPEAMIARHPFPGPGLGVRILCAEKADALPNVFELEKDMEAKFPNIQMQVLPIKSVGVQGDGRTYRHPVAIYPQQEISFAELTGIATKIPNISHELNRILLCLSHSQKLPNPEVQKTALTRDRIALLQEADAIVRAVLQENDFPEKKQIWQFPVVLVPLFFKGGESIILRPIQSEEAMTASPVNIPENILQEMSEQILEKLGPRISAVFFDLTSKPPATIEWE